MDKYGMTVTDIIDISKTKVKVCIDNGETFALYKGELNKFHIKTDTVLTDELYQQIMGEVLSKRAKLRSMNLLKSRDYTEHQLRTKLEQGFYPNRIIDEAVAYMISFGYIDDIRYAKSYIDYTESTKSRKQIENDLLRRGISKEDICSAYEEYVQEEQLTEEEQIIEKMLEKKRFDNQNATYEERQKIIGFLYRKGFSLDKIYKAVEKKEW